MQGSFQKHSTLGICILLLAGFAIRVWRASGTYLNPDEAMHFLAANQNSWRLAYRASLNLAHPPLLVFILHVWRHFGTSELVLRMPSILAGTVFCWLSYKWASMLFKQPVAWIVFILTLFLPSTIDLSSEVRQYALLLAFAMASAYLLERALETNSARAMFFSGACLWLAMSSHYSAFLFAAAMGIYAIFRMTARRLSRKVFAFWAIGQMVAIGLGCFFYLTHFSHLSQGGDPGSSIPYTWTASPYLPNSYYVPGKINPLLFILARTGGVFQYAFAQAIVGDAAYLAFAVGIILLFRKLATGLVPSRQLGALLILPFIVNCAAALARAYPYGGTRHSAFLIPFALAGVGLTLAHVLRSRLASGVTAAFLVALLCNVFPAHRQPYMSREDQSTAHMQAAMEFIHQQTNPAELIFTDYQTSLLLRHYLCDQRPATVSVSDQGFRTYECGGHRVIVANSTYIFSPRSFYDQWQILVEKYNLSPGTQVWVTQMGWSTNLAVELNKFPELHLSPHFFGNRIQVFDLTVGQSMPDPKLLPTS
jgi:hypothetical protein